MDSTPPENKPEPWYFVVSWDQPDGSAGLVVHTASGEQVFAWERQPEPQPDHIV